MVSLICGIEKKICTNELIYKTEIESQMYKAILLVLGEKRRGINLEIWTNIYTLLYIYNR